jgi:hypothetical protein
MFAVLEKEAAEGRLRLGYLDECGFSPSQPTTLTWMRQGERPIVRSLKRPLEQFIASRQNRCIRRRSVRRATEPSRSPWRAKLMSAILATVAPSQVRLL